MKLVLLFVSVLFSFQGISQNLVGLWEVTNVKVAGEEVTPQQRWFEFNADGTQFSGNGWIQHSHGTYVFDGAMLCTKDVNHPEDPYGCFKVEITRDNMVWERTEDGQRVKVYLARSQEVGPTMADQLVGTWRIFETNDSTLVIEELTLQIRWDGRFLWRTTTDEVYTGVWSAHGHNPELLMLPNGDALIENTRFHVEIEDERVYLSSSELDLTLERL